MTVTLKHVCVSDSKRLVIMNGLIVFQRNI